MEALILLSYTDALFWLYLLYFWISITLAWYIPGCVFLRHLGLSPLPHTTLSFLVGLVLWSWQGELFGLLHIRWATYGYLVIFFFLFIFQHKRMKRSHPTSFFSCTIATLLLVGLGVVFQQIPVWYTAIRTAEGLSFCCVLSINPVGQLALTNEIIRKIPPDQPGLSGQLLTNYHYWLNLTVAELVRVFRLPLLYTSSQYIPLFTSIFLGLSAITLSSLLGLSVSFARWFILFLYFGSDHGYIVPFVFGKGVNFHVPSLLNGFTFLFNPQTAISIVLMFCAFALFILFLKKLTPQTLFLSSLLFGTLIGFKVHTGIVVLIGLGILAAYHIRQKRYTTILVFSISLAIALAVYLPTNAGAGGIYFGGFWRIEEFMKNSDIGFNPSLLASIGYLTKQKRLFSEPFGTVVFVLLYEMLFLVLFLFSLVGTKVIGFFQSKKTLVPVPLPIHILIGSSIVVGMVLGLFFLQTSGVGHSEYFLHIAAITLCFYAALAVYRGDRRSRIMNVILLSVIVGTFIRSYQLGFDAISVMVEPKNHYVISNEELGALFFLRSHTPRDAVILVDPSNRLDSVVSYVSFMANRPTYLSGKWGLGAHNIRYVDRSQVVDRVFEENNLDIRKILQLAGITYVYLASSSETYEHLSGQIPVIFQNTKFTIFSVPSVP